MRHLNRFLAGKALGGKAPAGKAGGHPRRGLTLIELMVGLSIAATLAMAAAPYLGDYVANSRLREAGNTLLSETLFAQSEALKRNATVRVTASGDSIEVRDMTLGVNGTVIRTTALPAPAVAVTATTFNLGSEGRPTPFPTAVAINLAPTGAACTADRRCPGLRIDAGGAIRLCGDHTGSCP